VTALQTGWWLLVGVLLTVYAVLDGFDLGVGIWHLFARRDEDRRTLLRSIGPVWDGNEVWLLTGAGALFAAFPPVYAAVFSGLYLPLMVLLAALIARAVSFEFRNKEESPRWRRAWDVAFAFGSLVPALLFGVVVGNLLLGLPLDARGDFAGTPFDLLNPFAGLVGALAVFLLAAHGAAWIWIKTDGPLAAQARGWALVGTVFAVPLFLGASLWVLLGQPHLLRNFTACPALFTLPVVGLYALACAGWSILRGRPGQAFFFTSTAVVALMATFGASVFPDFVRASNPGATSLTAYNASSSPLTLQAMLVVALLGMPLVVGYTIWVYRKFRGKVGQGSVTMISIGRASERTSGW
jgi:cytochrome d ubiquinol oxidase subunit II